METKLICPKPQRQLSALEYDGAFEYTSQEVRDMTSNYSTPKRYGKYVGTLSNGEKVLVDRLHPSSASSINFFDQVHFLVK